MKKYLLLLPFLLLGLYLTFYPQINTVVYDCQAEQAITAWETQVEQAKEGNRPHPGKDAVCLYPELYEAMQAYNQKIAEEKQSGLTSPNVYEEPALSLSDYGLDDDAPVGTISIPAIDLELPLYLGASKHNMTKGAAVLGQTSLPVGGENTNCVIAGHRGYKGIPYFRNLDKLKAGDEVVITNFWGQMTYRVESTAIIQPNDRFGRNTDSGGPGSADPPDLPSLHGWHATNDDYMQKDELMMELVFLIFLLIGYIAALLLLGIYLILLIAGGMYWV